MHRGRVERSFREPSARLGNDVRLVVASALLGIGIGGLLHRALVAALGSWDRLAVVPEAPGSALRNDLLSLGPWISIGLGAAVFVLMRDGTKKRDVRRLAGISIAVAGLMVLVVGELELHVFRTIEQGWPAHNLVWDVLFHLPGEGVALLGWVLLPVPARHTSSGTRPSLSAGVER